MKKIIKSFFVFLVLFVFISAVNAETKEYNVEGITVTIDDGVMTFNGSGEIPKVPLYTSLWEEEKTNVEKIVIGEGITSIGDYTLYGFRNLKELVLPSTLISMPKGSALGLYLSEKLETIILAEGNKSFTIENNIIYNKDKTILIHYPRAKTDKVYKIPEGIKTIYAYGIVSNKYLEDIVLPSTLETYEPMGIQSIGNFKSIRFNGENANYFIEDDVLYNKDKTKLILMASYKTGKFVLPSSVTSLERYSFYKSSLSEIVLTNNITEIPFFAFGYCSNITNFIIPSSVTKIDSYGISYTNLTSLVIPSTVELLETQAIVANFEMTNVVVLNPNITIKAGALNSDYSNKEIYDGRIINLKSIIRGFDDSTAQEFASANNRTFLSLNDISSYDIKVNNQVYNGKTLKPNVKVYSGDFVLTKDVDYTISYSNNKNIGTASVTVSAKDGSKFRGSKTVKFSIKKNNPMTVKVKTATIKYKSLKKKNQSISVKKLFVIKKAKGKVTYSKVSGNSKITISKSGKVTVKKGLKKGKYKVKINVKSAGNNTYYSKTKKVTITIKVK